MSPTVSHPVRIVALVAAMGVAFALLLATASGAGAAGDGVVSDTTIEHTVVTGDTLWDIASTYRAPGEDVRRLVFDIQRVNDLENSVIVPGQVLRIPAS